MTKEEKIKKTIQIIATCIVSLLSLWFAVSCTMSMNVSKHNINSVQETQQSQATSVDSTRIEVPK